MNTLRQFSYKVSYLAEDKEIVNTIVGAKTKKDASKQAFANRRAMLGDRKVIYTRIERIYKTN